jgi:hypothetical protein
MVSPHFGFDRCVMLGHSALIGFLRLLGAFVV